MGSVVEEACFRAARPPLEMKTSLAAPTHASLLAPRLQETFRPRGGRLMGSEVEDMSLSQLQEPLDVQPAAQTRTQIPPGKPLSSFCSAIPCAPQSPAGAAGGGRGSWWTG